VADRIAAGEVVERPASVVKELAENALDAGATRISVVIEDAGRTLIKVVDDGWGMTGAELIQAIGRHATSKLRRFEDLESLATFGFRGEALPSIAAVSRLEIISRARGEEVGTILKVAGGRVERCEPVAAPDGTSVSIGHLFFNVPARRKFLRSDNTEFKWITTVFRHFALSFPEINFELFRGREAVYQLAAAEPRTRLVGLFGDDVAAEMLEINHRHGWLSVRGWISPPSLTQRTSGDQYLFVNRRPINSPRLNRAVYTAYEPNLVNGGHPIYAIHLEANPDRYDINVHPAKKEVKFADEEGTFAGVWAAVRNAVSAWHKPQEITPVKQPVKQMGASDIIAQRAQVPAPAHLTPYIPVPRGYQQPAGTATPFPRDDRRPFQPAAQPTSGPEPPTAPETLAPTARESSADGPVVWQVFDTYMVSPLTTGVVFIDQHIAHERVLYERALAAMEQEPWVSQTLLFPVTFNVRNEDLPMVEECLPLLRAMGFEVDPIGPREFRIVSAPAGVRIASEREMLIGIIDEYRDTAATQLDPRQRLAAAFACRGAVKAGQPLEVEEMRRLIDELFNTEDPEFCPHGRPIYHVLNRREIDKWFKR
jgi:DNA mismatch repair protein MutL